MSILYVSGSHSNVTAFGLVLLYEGLGRHNGYNAENDISSPIRHGIYLIWRT